MNPTSTRHLMCKSLSFKIIVTLSIIFTFSGSILGIIATNVTCKNQQITQVINKCAEYYTYNQNLCISNSVNYCCGKMYDPYMIQFTCQSNYYCYRLPEQPYPSQNQGNCESLIIIARSLQGLTILFLIIDLIIYCHFYRISGKLQNDPLNHYLMTLSREDLRNISQTHNQRKPQTNDQIQIQIQYASTQ